MFPVLFAAVLLPVTIWPTKDVDFIHVVTRPRRRFLGLTFLISNFTTGLNNYSVHGIAADRPQLNGKREKYWTVPCKRVLCRTIQGDVGP